MKQQVPQEFQKWHFIFRSRESELPKNIQMKLLFIASKIYDQHFDRSILNKELLEEHDELDRLDKVSLVILFKTLIKTFLKEKKFVELECKIKYKGVLEVWKSAKISMLEQNLIFFFEKSTIKYDLKYISVSNYLKSKKSFDVIFKRQVIATIKFYTSENYSDFKQFMQTRIEEKKEQKRIEQQLIKNLTNKKQQLYQVIPLKISPLQESNIKQNISQARESRSSSSQSQIHAENLLYKEKPEGFFIDYQKQNINFFVSKLQPKINITMILKIKIELEKIVNFYIHQKEWNSAITSQVITELQENLFQIKRIFKKDSIFQLQRMTITKVTVFCTKNSANITQQTISDAKSDKIICENASTTKFFKCLGGIKINVESSFDAKGYCKMKDSQHFLKKIYEDIKYLENSIKINELQMKNMKLIITPEKNLHLSFLKEPYLKKSQHLSFQQQQQQIDNIGTNDTIQLPHKKQNEIRKYPLVIQLRMTRPSETPSLEYMKQIIRFQHQKRYLRMRFDESTLKKYDDFTPSYCLSQLLKQKQYTISEEKELVFINKEVIKGQKNSLVFVLKQIGVNIFSGKQILNVSLPVDIFESRTLLERSAACFGLAPDYLIPIADSDPLTQIKNIVSLICSIPTLELIMLKPFNPILGQTFQAYIKGIPIYYEQISHHPPISSFYMTCPQFTMHGNLIPFADVNVNSALGGNQGITYIKLRNGSQFQCYFPPCQIGGLIFGNRTFRAFGRGYILQKNKNLFAEFSIQKQKKGLYESQNKKKLKAGDIIGGIFKIDPKVMKSISNQPSLRKFPGLESKNIGAKLASIRGTWFEQIIIDNEIMNKNKKIYPLEYQRVVLPSDSNYRLDVLYHKINDISQSQLQKEILQRKQRTDRKLREKYSKVQKKQK